MSEGKGQKLALPFVVWAQPAICYVDPQADFVQVKQSIADEWSARQRQKLTSFPSPDMLVMKPDEIKDVSLKSGHPLSDRDDLSVVLRKVDVFKGHDLASVDAKARQLCIFSPTSGPCSSLDELQAADLGAVEACIIQVGGADRLTRWENWEIDNLFIRKPDLTYKLVGLYARHSKTGEWKPCSTQAPSMYTLADHRQWAVYGTFATTEKPAWNKYFDRVVVLKEIRGNQYEVTYARFTDQATIEWLKAYFPDQRELYADPIDIQTAVLLNWIPTLKNLSGRPDGVKLLVEWLEAEFEKLLKPILAMVEQGRISFDALWYLFGKGNRIVYTVLDAATVTLTIEKAAYIHDFSRKYSLVCRTVQCNGRQFYESTETIQIGYFPDVIDIALLPVQLATIDHETKALEQFKRYEPFLMHLACPV